jgi:drug/metabolite transporter (DMT)-like permease
VPTPPFTPNSRATGWALFGLLAVAAAWGSSFPLTKALLDRMSALNFLAVRFSIAALLMIIVFFPALRRLSRRALTTGLLLGLAYGVAQILQTIGLQYTPASISGFITGMYVVLTPLCAALLLRSAIGGRVWLGAGIATVGLAILGLNGLSIGFGEAITLASALIYTVQLAVTALVSVLAALVVEGGVSMPSTGFDWAAIGYMAVVSGAVAMIVQSWAQAHLAPSRAAITMATEPAWAALFSILFLGEALTWRMAVGGGLMLAAMVIVESGH